MASSSETHTQAMNPLKYRIAAGLFWAASQTGAQQVAGLVVFSALAAILGPAPFGLIAMAMVILSLVLVVVDQGLLEGLLQRSEIEPEHVHSMFWFIQVVAAMFAVAMFATAGPIARMYGQQELVGILRTLSIIPIFVGLAAVPAALLRRELQFRAFAVRTMIAVVVGGAVGIALAMHEFGAWALVGNQLTQYGLSVVVLWTASTWRPRLQFSWPHLRALLPYGTQVTSIRGLTVLDNQAPRFLIGYAIGPLALGHLQLATTILRFLREIFATPFKVVAMPAMARIQYDPRRVGKLLQMATRLGNFLIYPAFAGIAVTAPLLVPVFFGNQWLPTVPLLQILTLSGFSGIYADMFEATLRGLGKPQWLLISRSAQLLFTIILSIAAAPYGVIAIAAVLAARGLILLPLNMWLLRRAGGPRLGPVVAANLPILIAALAMGACVAGWIYAMRDQLGDITLLASAVAVGVGFYAILALILVRPLLRDLLAEFRAMRGSTARVPGE